MLILCQKAPAWAGAFFIAVLGMAVGLAGTSALARPVVSVFEQRTHNVVMQQWDTSCGAATLATILNYQHGYPISERAIAQDMLKRGDPLKVKVRGGFSLLDMKRFANGLGFSAEGYQSLDLAQLVSLGPAIVAVNLGDYNHFVVFRGMVEDRVLIADPAFGNRSVDRAVFEQGWLRHIAFVVTSTAQRPGRTRLGPVLHDRVRVPADAVRNAIR